MNSQRKSEAIKRALKKERRRTGLDDMLGLRDANHPLEIKAERCPPLADVWASLPLHKTGKGHG